MSSQTKLDEFDKRDYILPEFTNGCNIEDKNNAVAIDHSQWFVVCGRCGSTMKRMGPVTSQWDTNQQWNPTLTSKYSCKASECTAGGADIGYFENEGEPDEVKISSKSKQRDGHQLEKFNNLQFVKVDLDDDTNKDKKEILVSQQEFDMHGWQEP